MRNERDLDNVNAPRRAFKEHKKNTGPLRVMSDSFDATEDAETQSHLDVRSLFSGEMTLAARTSTGEPAVVKVPHSILAVLVTIALAVIGAGYWLVSSITEIKTNVATIQSNQAEAKRIQASNLKLTVAYVTNETNRVQFMTGLLTPSARQAVLEWDKINPRPQLPSYEQELDER